MDGVIRWPAVLPRGHVPEAYMLLTDNSKKPLTIATLTFLLVLIRSGSNQFEPNRSTPIRPDPLPRQQARRGPVNYVLLAVIKLLAGRHQGWVSAAAASCYPVSR